MACYWCRKAGKKVPATIRIFSGIYAGEGFPACDEHHTIAETLALEPLASERIADGYKVTAFEVVFRGNEDGGSYRLGRQLWTATKKRPKATT
jgi:hypothetical protein